MGETQVGFYQACRVSDHSQKLASAIRPIFTNESSAAAAVEEEEREEEMECGVCNEPGVRVAVIKRGPKDPTEQEIKEHYATHVPFRSWCPHCVAAAAKCTPHKKTEEHETSVPRQHLDYWFMRDEKGADSVPVIVIKDEETKGFGAHVVTVKGGVEWVATRVIEDIKAFGHNDEVILKSDQEVALRDLVHEVERQRGLEKKTTLFEESKVYDSQSNGTAERAVQTIECITRTHKLALEKRIGRKIPSTHPVMTWLVEHGADMLNKYLVGRDGRTTYERIKGKAYKGEMTDFGRRVFHMHPGKHSGGSMQARWSNGVVLGKLWLSDEWIIYTEDDKIVKARSIKYMSEEDSWKAEAIEKIKVTRWKAQFIDGEIQLDERDTGRPGDEPVARVVIPRDFNITQEVLEQHGYS